MSKQTNKIKKTNQVQYLSNTDVQFLSWEALTETQQSQFLQKFIEAKCQDPDLLSMIIDCDCLVTDWENHKGQIYYDLGRGRSLAATIDIIDYGKASAYFSNYLEPMQVADLMFNARLRYLDINTETHRISDFFEYDSDCYVNLFYGLEDEHSDAYTRAQDRAGELAEEDNEALKEALSDLASKYLKAIEREYEYRTGEEGCKEEIQEAEHKFNPVTQKIQY
jgi:hypothetical protein